MPAEPEGIGKEYIHLPFHGLSKPISCRTRRDSLRAEVEEWNHCLAIRSHAELQKLFQLSFIDGAWSLGLEKLSEQELKALRIGFYGADGKLIKSWTAADIREGRLSLGSWASQDRGRLFLKISGQGWSLSKTLTAR